MYALVGDVRKVAIGEPKSSCRDRLVVGTSGSSSPAMTEHESVSSHSASIQNAGCFLRSVSGRDRQHENATAAGY
jgi:hypothetical protein